jgi:hypothetical protein
MIPFSDILIAMIPIKTNLAILAIMAFSEKDYS